MITITEYMDFLEMREDTLTAKNETLHVWMSVNKQIGVMTKEVFMKYMASRMDVNIFGDYRNEYYVTCDITEISNDHRFVCYNKKNSDKKDWHIFPSIHFRNIEKYFGMKYFYLPRKKFLPAFCDIDIEHKLVVAGAIYNNENPADMYYVTDDDKIYDYAMDNGGALQQGLDEWI